MEGVVSYPWISPKCFFGTKIPKDQEPSHLFMDTHSSSTSTDPSVGGNTKSLSVEKQTGLTAKDTAHTWKNPTESSGIFPGC